MSNHQNSEEAKLHILGQTLQLLWKSGATKVFVQILLIISFVSIVFSFRIPPLIPFLLIAFTAIGILIYFAILLPQKPELFQDSKTWLGHQRLLVGNKKMGLYLSNPNETLFQPVTKTKTIDTRGNIIISKKKDDS